VKEAIKILNEAAEQAREALERLEECLTGHFEMEEIDLDVTLPPTKHNFPEPMPIKVSTLPLGRRKNIYHCRNNC
jgi:hypothetical protein